MSLKPIAPGTRVRVEAVSYPREGWLDDLAAVEPGGVKVLVTCGEGSGARTPPSHLHA